MKTNFTTPHSNKEVTVKPERDTIGPGGLGAKTAGLRKHQPLLERCGFGYLPQVAITPGFFSDFLRRAGVSHEAPEEAPRAIRSTDFSKTELEAIRASVQPFSELYAAVRSDECTAAGTGLGASGFVLADNSEEIIGRVAGIVKGILASDFSRDMVAFKRRVGLPMKQTPGVLVMPVDTTPIPSAGIHTTLFHVNAVNDFARGDALIQMGIGIGGANRKFARVVLLGDLDTSHPRFLSDYAETAYGFSNGAMKQLKEGVDESDLADLELEFGGLTQSLGADAISDLRHGFHALKANGNPPLYMELAYNGYHWLVIQCSNVIQKHVTRPEETGKKILEVKPEPMQLSPRFGLNVSGRGIIESGKAVLVRATTDLATLAAINKATKDYVLVLDMDLRALSDHFSFADYSNAAAIISTQETKRPAISHFNGALREAGIAVLAGDVDEDFLNGLKSGEISSRDLLVYANDELEEGFVLDRG